MKPLTLRHEIDEVLHEDTDIWSVFDIEGVVEVTFIDCLKVTFIDCLKAYEEGEVSTIFYAPTDSVRFMWE